MIISEKQILQLITIANAFLTACFRLGAYETTMQQVQELLFSINDQQSEELKEVK